MTVGLMAYVPTGTVTGMSPDTIVPDFANNRFYSSYAGVGTEGVSQFVGYESGDVSLSRSVAALGMLDISNGPMCLTYGRKLILPQNSGANSVSLAQINAANLTLVSTVFTANASLSPSDSTHLLSPGYLVPIRGGRTDYVLATPFAAHGGEVAAISIPGLAVTNLGSTTQTGTAILGRGLVSDSGGSAYVVGRGTNVFALYKVTMAPAALPVLSAALATFVPSAIDPTWSTFSRVNGCAYDQTDDSVIIGVKTNDAVAQPNYICKLNGTTGALVWKVPINYYHLRVDGAWLNSTIVNSRFYVWTSSGVLHTIDTAAGTSTSMAIPGMSVAFGGGGISEDINDSITSNGTWAEGALVPTYLGTYMGDEGHHAYTGWMRLFPNVPPPPVPTPVVSVNRSWTYTLDGHTFYVLDLGEQGTFAFDTTTQQWSQFVTGTPSSTYGTPSPQWGMQNGCMWGTRIVAGGLSGSTVWEMTPDSVLDNDATAITHVATGGITTRSRTYHSVEAVRVAASVGLLDGAGPVTFNLRFSDDQGRNWSPYFPVTLTAADYSGEIAWRSLGAFAAPGRIFELWDVGGLVRIDGMDVFVDGFDGNEGK